MTEEQVQYVLNSERYIEAVKKMMVIYPNGFDIKKIDKRIKNKLEELTTINPKLAVNNKRIEIEEPEELTLTWKEKLMMFIKR